MNYVGKTAIYRTVTQWSSWRVLFDKLQCLYFSLKKNSHNSSRNKKSVTLHREHNACI